MLPMWIICENIFREIIEIVIIFLQKFSDAKISWYTVYIDTGAHIDTGAPKQS